MIEPVLIEPKALYDDGALRQALGLSPATLAAARSAGKLRHTRKGKRTLYKGAWILAWLDSEAEPRQDAHEPHHQAPGREVGHGA